MWNLYCLLYNASYKEKLFKSASMNNKMAYIYQWSSKIHAYSHFISALSQNCTNLSTVQKNTSRHDSTRQISAWSVQNKGIKIVLQN